MEFIINPIGGLANRMRAIASGISLSNDKNIKIKNIIWPVNSDLYCPFDDLFEPLKNIDIVNISNIQQLLLFDEPRKKNLYLSKLFQLSKYCGKLLDTRNDIIDYIDTIQHNSKPLLIQSGVIYYDFSPEFYRSLFIPKKKFIESANKRLSNNSNIIGLHIRRTDNSISIEKSPTSLFIDTIKKELNNDSTIKFYLASDDDTIKGELTGLFGTDKIICSASTAIRSTKRGIQEALVELLCLSKCKKIYGSFWSSYSEAAAMIGNIELKQLSLL